MKKVHESEVIDNEIAYFRFLKGNPVESYAKGLDEFIEMAQQPQVNALFVVVEDDEAMFGKDMQQVWLDTGEFADKNGIEKWGIVVPSMAKQITIEFLVQGGSDGIREYDYYLSDDENDVLEWCKS